MAAVSPVTTSSVPPPPAGGNVPSLTQQGASGSQLPVPAAASAPVLSTSDAAKVILTQPAPAAEYNPPPTEQQIQSALSALLQQLDNQPQEHPNAPAVVLLQNKETALRAALTQVLLGVPGPEEAYLSGVVLNAAV
jgi:hypothetical protein